MMNKNELEELYRTKTMREIADEFGVSRQAISNWAKKLGVKKYCKCGKEIARNRKYCSKDCQIGIYNSIAKCIWCGKEFECRQSENWKRKFCSVRCKERFYNDKRAKNGKQQYLMARLRGQKYSEEKLKLLLAKNEDLSDGKRIVGKKAIAKAYREILKNKFNS